MIRRVLVAAFAVSLFIPAAGSAQLMPLQDDPTWQPRFRVTPFFGHLTSVNREEEWIFRGDTENRFVQSDMKLGSGSAIGVNIETPLIGRFGATAAVAYGSRGEAIFTVRQTGEELVIDGSNVMLARLGAVLHLMERESDLTMRRLGASVHAGAVVMHDRPKNDFGTADFVGNATHFGLNFGVSAELPFASDRFALQAGLEDNVIRWSEGQLADLAYEYFGQPGTGRAQTAANSGVSHAWLMRAGISFRFR